MKTSTALAMALVSASCYAAPLHTGDSQSIPARDAASVHPAAVSLRADAAPVSAPAPDITAQGLDHAHWSHLPLPRSHSPSHGMASQLIDVQT